jgi:hypothetical protein
MNRLRAELESFSRIWKGGYYEGNPLDPLGWSSYGPIGFISGLHATYLRCIRPYVDARTVALEIGPGRGAWTKALLPAKTIYVMDALSAEHNRFWDYIPREEEERIKYLHVQDFSCMELPQNHFNYMFSFGALCHVSFEGIEAYAKNIYPKLKKGADCFWMIADYKKYNAAVTNLREIGIYHRLISPEFSEKWLSNFILGRIHRRLKFTQAKLPVDESNAPSPGRWYDAGVERTCLMLESLGYQVVDPDVGTCLRDPIIHFRKK